MVVSRRPAVGGARRIGTRSRPSIVVRVGRRRSAGISRRRERDTDYEVIIREALADLVEHPENCRCVRRPGRRRGRRR